MGAWAWCAVALGVGAPDEERSWEQMGEAPTLLHKIVTALWSQRQWGASWYIKAQSVYVGTRKERQHRDADS